MNRHPQVGAGQDALFDLTRLPPDAPPGPMTGGCCSCGAAIDRPVNGPRPACTHSERVAARAAALEWVADRCSPRMAENFASWCAEAGPRRAPEFAEAFEQWLAIMGRWFEYYEAQERGENPAPPPPPHGF
ncbi:hypothetical protein ACIQF6_35835 [Kitasatospora sp. NPDC092948]|uniref:hypothetical protein n=1 Tax=Kitasatospora sp. NPDC092948 TaxID=3364088 RepID=UPI003801824C